MSFRECKTQAEVEAAVAAGDIVVLRGSARAELYGSASARLYGSASAELYGSARAELYGSASAVLRDSASAELYGSASAELYGSARAELYGSARAVLRNSARAVEGSTGRALRQSRPVVLIGPIGSRNAMLSVYQCEGGGQLIRTGCFLGSPAELRAAVSQTHPNGQYADEYAAALAMIDALARRAA